jgi:hypothetical protein
MAKRRGRTFGSTRLAVDFIVNPRLHFSSEFQASGVERA